MSHASLPVDALHGVRCFAALGDAPLMWDVGKIWTVRAWSAAVCDDTAAVSIAPLTRSRPHPRLSERPCVTDKWPVLESRVAAHA
jgi:hypothetical protein